MTTLPLPLYEELKEIAAPFGGMAEAGKVLSYSDIRWLLLHPSPVIIVKPWALQLNLKEYGYKEGSLYFVADRNGNSLYSSRSSTGSFGGEEDLLEILKHPHGSLLQLQFETTAGYSTIILWLYTKFTLAQRREIVQEWADHRDKVNPVITHNELFIDSTTLPKQGVFEIYTTSGSWNQQLDSEQVAQASSVVTKYKSGDTAVFYPKESTWISIAYIPSGSLTEDNSNKEKFFSLLEGVRGVGARRIKQGRNRTYFLSFDNEFLVDSNLILGQNINSLAVIDSYDAENKLRLEATLGLTPSIEIVGEASVSLTFSAETTLSTKFTGSAYAIAKPVNHIQLTASVQGQSETAMTSNKEASIDLVGSGTVNVVATPRPGLQALLVGNSSAAYIYSVKAIEDIVYVEASATLVGVSTTRVNLDDLGSSEALLVGDTNITTAVHKQAYVKAKVTGNAQAIEDIFSPRYKTQGSAHANVGLSKDSYAAVSAAGSSFTELKLEAFFGSAADISGSSVASCKFSDSTVAIKATVNGAANTAASFGLNSGLTPITWQGGGEAVMQAHVIRKISTNNIQGQNINGDSLTGLVSYQETNLALAAQGDTLIAAALYADSFTGATLSGSSQASIAINTTVGMSAVGSAQATTALRSRLGFAGLAAGNSEVLMSSLVSYLILEAVSGNSEILTEGEWLTQIIALRGDSVATADLTHVLTHWRSLIGSAAASLEILKVTPSSAAFVGHSEVTAAGQVITSISEALVGDSVATAAPMIMPVTITDVQLEGNSEVIVTAAVIDSSGAEAQLEGKSEVSAAAQAIAYNATALEGSSEVSAAMNVADVTSIEVLLVGDSESSLEAKVAAYDSAIIEGGSETVIEAHTILLGSSAAAGESEAIVTVS